MHVFMSVYMASLSCLLPSLLSFPLLLTHVACVCFHIFGWARGDKGAAQVASEAGEAALQAECHGPV